MAKHTYFLAFLAAFPALGASPANNGIPLFFVANGGQTSPEVRFMAKGSGVTAYFLQSQAVFRMFGASIRMQLVGANPDVRIEGANLLAGRVNFFGGVEGNWHTGLPMYGAVAYRDLYTGIDMVYGGSGRNLKSEFLVAAGADPSQIRVRYAGASDVRIDADGALATSVNGEVLRERAPEAYQYRGAKRVAVESRFQARADGEFGFAIGSYDQSLPLVIDPVLSYSTLLGGSGADAANALAVDATGAAYIAGYTESFDLPTLNPEQSASGGGNDVFVAKLNSTGNALLYCTYLGGTGDDRAFGIALDSTGAAYVTGSTQSANFPVRNALQANLAGGKNAFVVKLTPTGNGLAYSTFLGGKGSDSGNGVAVDSSGNAYVVGDTTSTNFPVNGFQKTYRGGQDAFVTKLNAGGSLAYSTYLGGGSFDHGAAIAVDAGGTAYIAGSTSSTDFPLANAFQVANGGGQDAFIARLNAAGTSLVFSTFLGGNGGATGYPEAAQGIALDSAGNAYVTGVTSSTNFPLMNPAQSTLNGSTDAFVAKMSATGALAYSTYLGGSGMESGNAIAVDASGNAYIGGYTYSIDLPVVSPIQSTMGGMGSTDAFVGKLSPAGNAVSLLTYLGGNDSDTATGIAVDSSGSIYVAGWTLSSNFPVLNAYQTSNAGNYGTFVTKYVFSVGPVNVGVTPNSGGGPAPVFSFQYSDANGASDLTAVAALFNTSSSLAGGCAVIYNVAQNTLQLLTDSGAQPAASLTPGGGAQQNSQCVLSGGGSSVSLSGNLLTLNLAVIFQGSFAGAKNIYMQAANPFQLTPWQAEGTWGVLPAITMTATPSSGSATQQTFNFQVSDSLGATDLSSIGVLFGSSVNTTGACSVTYNRAQNTLALLTDAGAAPASSFTPGTGTQQNSQCVLNGAGSSVLMAGNLLTLNLALSFQPAFGGTKNVYMDAVSRNGKLPWTQEGTWTSPPVVTMAVSPALGNAVQQIFSVQVSDSTGAADLTSAGLLFNATASTGGGCAINYNQAQNKLTLLTDSGAVPASSITPGGGAQQNSQCVLNGGGSSVTSSGNTLTLNLQIAFQPGFGGTKNIYVDAVNPYETVNWQAEGTWTVASTLGVSVTPSFGSGTQQTFNLQVSDPLGAAELTTVGLLINSSTSTAGACAVLYNRVQNTMALLTDAGAQPAASITPGSGTQQNSQCVLNGSGSSAAFSGNILVLNLAISFQPAFSGTKSVYAEVIAASQTLNWQQEGIWTSPPVVTMAVTPSSGGGSQQKFVLQVTDSLAGTDLTSVGLLINSTASTAGACAVIYNSAQNSLALLTDAGAQPASSIAPGSGTQQNSQCVLSGSGSSVSASGNALTLNLALTFQPAFFGLKNIYMDAANPYETVNWQAEGTWVSAPVPAISVTPSSGVAAQQTFALQVSDALGATDLSTVGILFNSTTSVAGACAVTYNRAQNALMLLTDAGAQPAASITPGSGAQQNSQCVLNGAGSSVSASGNTLTLNLMLMFLPAFSGAKNLYAESISMYQTVNWQQQGTWASPPVVTMAVTPSSGGGVQQKFVVQLTDSLAGSDLTTVGLLINSAASTAGACAVIYNSAQNSLALLTDTGAQPISSISPGSGTQQNSQCVLSGSGSSVSASGNTLTLSLMLTFQTAFGGTKNIYVDAANPFETVNWQLEGTWVTIPVIAASVTPAAGSGPQQTFSFQFSDSAGTTDLMTAGALINATAATAGACAVIYNRPQNSLMLLTDSGGQPAGSISPGSGTQSNSQCTLNGAGSSASVSGSTLTLNLSLSFQTAFDGVKNIYMDTVDSSAASAWLPAGTWAATPAGPSVVSVAPGSGSGNQQTFSLRYSDSAGAADLSTVWVWVTTNFNAATAANSCLLYYARATNQLFQLNDAGNVWSPGTAGTGSVLSNSQCSVSMGGVSATASGADLFLNLTLAFMSAYSGNKSVYMYAASNSGAISGWLQKGSWNVTLPAVTPVTAPTLTESVTPASGSGAQQTFALHYTDSAGVADLSTVWMWVTTNFNTTTSANSCLLYYARATNQLFQLNDAGNVWSPTTPGTASILSNSQCSINASGVSVTPSGTSLILNLPVTFTSAYSGNKSVYMYAASGGGTASGWQQEGSWTAALPAVTPVTTPTLTAASVTPASGSGAQQTFALHYTDSAGVADLSTAWVWITSNFSTTSANSCLLYYARATNQLFLINDAGTAWSPATPGTEVTLSNSECSVNVTGTSVTATATDLILNVPLTFAFAYSGSKSVYLYAAAGDGTVSGWHQAGSWTVTPPVAAAVTPPTLTAASVTPASGSGTQQTFTLQYTDSAGAADLSTVWVWITSNYNATTSANSCLFYYARATNQLFLINDAGTGWSSPASPGAAVTLSNSECSTNAAAVSVAASGTGLILNLPVNFTAAYNGSKSIYMFAQSAGDTTTGWQSGGTWVVR